MSAFLPLFNAAIGGIAGAASGNKVTPDQQRRQRILDELVRSLTGEGGSFDDLFRLDDEAFQRSFVDPAKQLFRDQIAPEIQQSFIASGQQRGTGLDDQLTRAGVDLDQILNQQFAQMQENAMERKLRALGLAAQGESGVPASESAFERFLKGAAGSLTSSSSGDQFGEVFSNLFSGRSSSTASGRNPSVSTNVSVRRGARR
ncbi:MAG: hypothetical protein VW258_15050 [Thalassolituus sp.]